MKRNRDLFRMKLVQQRLIPMEKLCQYFAVMDNYRGIIASRARINFWNCVSLLARKLSGRALRNF